MHVSNVRSEIRDMLELLFASLDCVVVEVDVDVDVDVDCGEMWSKKGGGR
jgi:hypothetical protein